MTLHRPIFSIATTALLFIASAVLQADTSNKPFVGDPLAAYFKQQITQAGGLAQAKKAASSQNEEIYLKCVVCHSATQGKSKQLNKVSVPNISAQQPLYLFKQLSNLHSGARIHPVMKVMTKDLTDQQRLQISLRFSANPLATYSGKPLQADPQQGEKIYRTLCVHCHGDGAMGMGAIPRLKGQNPHYLTGTLKLFRDKGRFRTHAGMTAITAKLTDAQIDSLSVFLANFSHSKPTRQNSQ
jgi:cytochrome c553